MKKNYSLLKALKPAMRSVLGCCLLLTASHAFAQSEPWNVYGGDVMPDELVINPFVTASVNPAATAELPAVISSEQSIIDDPDMAGNKLLSFRIDNTNHTTFLWRQNFPTSPAPTAATVVVRAKGMEGVDRVFELDLDFNGFRETIYINNNGTFTFNVTRGDLQNASLGTDFNTQEWHTYRFTKDGAEVKMYVDESTTPIATATVPSGTVRNYFRIGDGSSGSTNGSLIDYILWDVTGAYSPDQKAIPQGILMKAKPEAAALGKVSVYPNPAKGNKASLSFFLPASSDVSIQLFDLTGKKIGQSVNFVNVAAGQTEVNLPIAGLKEGTYLYQVNTNRYSVTQKMVVQ